MSTFATYNTLIEQKLANSSEVFFTEEMKRQAANDTIKQILQDYDIPEMIVKTHISFDSNGWAAKPSTYFRMVKLWASTLSGSITAFADGGGGTVTVTSAAHGLSNGDIVIITGTTNYNGTFTVASVATNTFVITDTWVSDDATGSWSQGVEKAEYVYVVPDLLDRQAVTSAYYWSEDYDAGASSVKLKVWPTDSGVLDIRFIKLPVAMTDDVTDSGLSAQWDEVVAYGVAQRLLVISDRYQEAQIYQQEFERRIVEVYLALKNPGGIKQNNRIKSKYERHSLLGGFRTGKRNSDSNN